MPSFLYRLHGNQLVLESLRLQKFIKRFSWSGGLPSHLYPGIASTIHEGSELGYTLATSGVVVDNPELVFTGYGYQV